MAHKASEVLAKLKEQSASNLGKAPTKSNGVIDGRKIKYKKSDSDQDQDQPQEKK